MPKFYGKIGYAETAETSPGIWEEQIVEKSYRGELLQNIRSLQNSGNVNDNINISNRISIVANPYTRNHYYAMRYVEFMGTKWKISNAEVQYPRLILTLGGEYNGQQAQSAN